MGLCDVHLLFVEEVGKCQVSIVVHWQFQAVCGLTGVHDVIVMEAALFAGVEREVHVVGILAEDILEGVLEQVGHLVFETASQHGLHLCGQIRAQGHIIFDAEQGGAVAQILGDAHEVTPRG